MSPSLLYYDLGPEVTAFTTQRGAELPFPVVQAHQVHGDAIAYVDSPRLTRDDLEGIDALITDVPGIAVGARTADCIPVLLYDPVRRAVAAVHAGWRGTVLRISTKVLREMATRFGTSSADVRAVIGPGISFDSFQVGEEVVEAFRSAGFPMKQIHAFFGPRVPDTMQGGHHLDLWKANRWLLTECGLRDENIHTAGLCTYTLNSRFYSARREGIRCPRLITAIRMNPDR